MAAAGNPGGQARLQIPGIYHGEPESSRRHGMMLGFPLLVERDLYAGDARQMLDLRHQLVGRMAIAGTVRAEQHHAVSVAAVVIGKVP